MPIARPARHLSALWVVGLAFAAMTIALSGGLPGWATRTGATQLADSHFVPDEAVLPAAPVASTPAEGPSHAELSSGRLDALRATPTMHWNGRSDQVWTLADGRHFVVSPWGATWWQAEGQRLRTPLDLPGLDPALGARQLADDRLLIPRHGGGAWLLDLSADPPRVQTLSDGEAASR